MYSMNYSTDSLLCLNQATKNCNKYNKLIYFFHNYYTAT